MVPADAPDRVPVAGVDGGPVTVAGDLEALMGTRRLVDKSR